MSAVHVLPVLALMLSAAAVAQEAPPRAPEPAVISMPQDCTKSMPRHDARAEEGAATPKAGTCPMAAIARPASGKAKPGHDHARVHKLM